MRTVTQTKTKTAAPRTKLSKKATKPVKVVAAPPLASKAAARTIGETTAPKGTVALKVLCKEVGIDPKVARRELRKIRREAIAEGEKSNPLVAKHDLHTRWFLSGEFLKTARTVLVAYVARNGKEEE